MARRLTTRQSLLREIPAVHEILKRPLLIEAERDGKVSRWALRRAVQSVLERRRAQILRDGEKGEVSDAPLELEILEEAGTLQRGSLRPVINATGVILHTNLGRSPLAGDALHAIQEVAKGYCNLELNLADGKRGLRYEHVEDLLCELTGAEAALVVNNNAAGVFLGLRVLAKDKEVIVSRGELVEIGGSFRIPEILEESGAALVEVGTTNRVHLKDYEKAIGASTGLFLKVHPSNYHVIGFHKEVSLKELVALGRRFSLPVMQDLGSGCMLAPSDLGMQGEPTVAEAVKTEADLVTFSGDKLLGGPQAGILLGRKEVLEAAQRHPLNRALRIDKLTLAALEATLLLYRDRVLARERIPVLNMLSVPLKTLQSRARRLAKALGQTLPEEFRIQARPSICRAGGGSLPMESIPGVAVHVKSHTIPAQELLSKIRSSPVPVIARVERDEVILDVRTLQQGDASRICKAFQSVLQNSLFESGCGETSLQESDSEKV